MESIVLLATNRMLALNWRSPDWQPAVRGDAQHHDDGGFDRVLVGYGAVATESWAVANAVLHHTKKLKVMVAHRPGFTQPVVLARMAATLDHLTGDGRVAIHFITGGDEADQRREGDFVPTTPAIGHRRRNVNRAAHLNWGRPFDFDGQFFRYENAFSSVKPVTPGDIPLYFAGASPPAIEVGAAQADVFAFWGEPRAAVAGRMEIINQAATKAGRTVRYSISLRPIVADTKDEAREKAEWIAAKTAERIELTKKRMSGHEDSYERFGGERNATFSVDRDTSGTTSVGRKRLIEMSASQDVYDERLWMKVANLTGAAGNSTALVGTPEQVAEAMPRYYDLGITALLLKGFDPLPNAIDFGQRRLPLVREGAAKRDSATQAWFDCLTERRGIDRMFASHSSHTLEKRCNVEATFLPRRWRSFLDALKHLPQTIAKIERL
jgi:alkanesulfonate monooxygenase